MVTAAGGVFFPGRTRGKNAGARCCLLAPAAHPTRMLRPDEPNFWRVSTVEMFTAATTANLGPA